MSRLYISIQFYAQTSRAQLPLRSEWTCSEPRETLCTAEQNETLKLLQEESFCQISRNGYDGEGEGRTFTRCIWNETTGFDERLELTHTEEKSNKMVPQWSHFFVFFVTSDSTLVHRGGEHLMPERSYFFTIRFIHYCLLMIVLSRHYIQLLI